MRLRLLGCSGGELGPLRATSYLLDGGVAVDAGSLTSDPSLDELLALEHVVLTHAHLDHTKDLPLVADLFLGRRERPLHVHALPETVAALREGLFRGGTWPDLTRLPEPRRPLLAFHALEAGRAARVGPYEVVPVPVAHGPGACGLLLSDGSGTVAISGDTGPTHELWARARAARDLRAVLVEASFPSRLQELADRTQHLTPTTLRGELAKLDRPDVEILAVHLKPAFDAELRDELRALGVAGLGVPVRGDVVEG